MAVFKAVETAIQFDLREILIVTDSIYVRNGFVEHLPAWKASNMMCANKKPLKHGHIIKYIDEMVTQGELIVYWKKTKGHSKTPGEEKKFNDIADALANKGAREGEILPIPEPPIERECAAVTRAQAQAQQDDQIAQWGNEMPSADLVSAQRRDKTIGKFYAHVCEPLTNVITEEDMEKDEELRILMKFKNNFSIQNDLLIRNSKKGNLQWVVPLDFRGIMLGHAHDEITSGHRGANITMEILSQVAYWPKMSADVEQYCRGCLQCAQMQPTAPHHRAPLQKRGLVFPWSDIQIDFIGPVVKSFKGNCYMLTVTCLFTKWVECFPTKNCRADTAALILINQVFARHGLCYRLSSDRGSHFTADIMTRTWEMLGVKQQLHIAYRPASSGSVERYNKTIIGMLKKFVDETGRDWDIKLPLILMAIRATPSKSTGYSPFQLLTGRSMITPTHLLYHTTEQTLIGATTTHEYVTGLRKHLQYAFGQAQKHLERSAEQSKTYYDKKASKIQYEIGDQVYIFNFKRDKSKEKKFLPSWNGPYSIINKISPVVYKIKVTKGDAVTERWAHINQLKPSHPKERVKEIENKEVNEEQTGKK